MTRPRRAAHARRPGQHGITLIDTLVAVAIMALSIVVIVGGFASAARNAALSSDAAQLQVAMGHLAGWFGSAEIPYTFCPPNPGNGDKSSKWLVDYYNAQYANNPLPPQTPPDKISVPAAANPVTSAVHATGGTLSKTAQYTALTNCIDASNGDWGVQQLQLTITSPSGRSQTQTVYKGAGLMVPPQSLTHFIGCAHPPLSTGEPEIFDVNGQKGNPLNIIPPAGSPITAGSTIGAVYSDEKQLNNTGTSAPLITIDDVPLTGISVTPSSSKEQYTYNITGTVPTGIASGNHTAIVQACDNDQNKNGGDYGTATFSFTVQ